MTTAFMRYAIALDAATLLRDVCRREMNHEGFGSPYLTYA
jgi:hypothetical protein